MENEPTTKTPIPPRPGFRNFAFCILIFALPNPLSICLFVPSCLSGPDSRSTLVESPLQIALFSAKRTQFSQRQNQRNLLCRKGLPKQTTPGHSRKTNPNEPNLSKRKNAPKPLPRKALWKNFVSSTPAKRTQSNPIPPSRWDEIRDTRCEAKPPIPNVYPDFAFNSLWKG
jgi:hypothetical protein